MRAKAVFLGVPFDQATVYRSESSHATRALRYVSEMFLPYLGDFDIDVLEEFRLADAGDVPMIPADAARSRAHMERYVGEILESGAMPICVGGDHSIPIPIAAALSRHFTGRFGYIHFDAHIDCQPHFAGERFTNWSHVARMIEFPNVDPHNVVIVGARGALNPPEQWDFVEEHRIRVYRMREIEERGIEAVVTGALDLVTDGTEGFYCSLDSDVVDASAMPGTDAPEPGGRPVLKTDAAGLRTDRGEEARRPRYRGAHPRLRSPSHNFSSARRVHDSACPGRLGYRRGRLGYRREAGWVVIRPPARGPTREG
jgi:agmatinase